MKIGLIIPCYNVANKIKAKEFINFIESNNEYHICLVNGGSKDDTLSILIYIRSQTNGKVSVVDIRSHKGTRKAIRIGWRYLCNIREIIEIKHIDVDVTSIDSKLIKDNISTNKNLSMHSRFRK
ncbi:glycosyltransferase [Urechidicola croceus]|uniref:Glycosyltransferase 2-like domain-containing protein n=1 Tax=Urechidicola croceus TaxID=1850246 RepID=A0A1D8P7C0_9FLAO|nr:glycosyltransferase [Urechidicola croceus]AOW20485.1 hypothetical protein LPB138_07270 [Urechidicola croceus]